MQGCLATLSGWSCLRYKFRIWPGRGGPIETTFEQALPGALRRIDPEYADWVIAVRTHTLMPTAFQRSSQFSTPRPGTRENSPTFAVTTVRP